MTRVTWRDAVAVAVLAAALYIATGTLGAYLARDDFQWLNDARDLGIGHAFVLTGRSHFYRPVVEVWWVGATHVCGTRTGCYHLLELLLHVGNGILLLFLTARVFGRRDLALATAVIFVVLPSYIEAVVWVCAVTTAFAAMWYLLALHFALDRPGSTTRRWAACAACAAAAMYSHEATATLFATIPLVRWTAGQTARPRLREAAPFALLAIALAITTVVANRRNYVFAEGHYEPGRHAIGHAIDYVRSIYVGSGSAVELATVAACVLLIAARGSRPMHAGLLWMVVTMPPYLWFTWGNVGRYTYLPSMGFTWIVAGAIVSARDALDRRVGGRTWIGRAVATVLVIAVAGRFAAFAQRAIKGEIRWMEAYRAYGDKVMPLLADRGAALDIPAPENPLVEDAYVAPMLEWRTSRPGLQLRLVRPPASSPSPR